MDKTMFMGIPTLYVFLICIQLFGILTADDFRAMLPALDHKRGPDKQAKIERLYKRLIALDTVEWVPVGLVAKLK